MSKNALVSEEYIIRETFKYDISNNFFNYDGVSVRDSVVITFVDKKLYGVDIDTNNVLKERIKWLLNDAISDRIKIIENKMEERK